MVIVVRKSILFSICLVIVFAFVLTFLAITSVYAISVDDSTICYVRSYQDGRSAIDGYVEEEKEKFKDITTVKQKIALDYCFAKSTFRYAQVEEAKSLLKENTSFNLEYKETIPIEAKTKVLPSASLPVGVEEMIYEGSDGEQENTVHAVVANEDVTEIEIIESEVLVEAKNAVILQGTSPMFYHIIDFGGFGASPVPLKGEISATFGTSGQLWSSTHTGVDIAAEEGASVYSVGCGTVIHAGESGKYGNMVAIDHGNGIITRYAHLLSVAVRVGDSVQTESFIGNCGSTGNATGSHLHFEVLIDNAPVNPESYFSETLG